MTRLIDLANAADKISCKGDRYKKAWVDTHGKILVDEVLRQVKLSYVWGREDLKILESKIYNHLGIEFDAGKYVP